MKDKRGVANSWNWRIVEWELYWRERFGNVEAILLEQNKSENCSKKGCTKLAECHVAYDYVTGSRGLVGVNQKALLPGARR